MDYQVQPSDQLPFDVFIKSEKALPNIPIIGMGGIRNGRDAIEFFAAGANAISVGTTVFNDPEACVRIHDETAEILQEKASARCPKLLVPLTEKIYR